MILVFLFYYGFPRFSIGFYRFCKASGQVSLLWASPSSISSSLTRNKEIWSSLISSGPLLPLFLSLRVMEGIERQEWPTPSPKRLRKAKKNNENHRKPPESQEKQRKSNRNNRCNEKQGNTTLRKARQPKSREKQRQAKKSNEKQRKANKSN